MASAYREKLIHVMRIPGWQYYPENALKRETKVREKPTGVRSVCASCGIDFGNTGPLLAEILEALERYCETGESHLIDLAAIPFGPGDEQRLKQVLGQ